MVTRFQDLTNQSGHEPTRSGQHMQYDCALEYDLNSVSRILDLSRYEVSLFQTMHDNHHTFCGGTLATIYILSDARDNITEVICSCLYSPIA